MYNAANPARVCGIGGQNLAGDICRQACRRSRRNIPRVERLGNKSVLAAEIVSVIKTTNPAGVSAGLVGPRSGYITAV